MRVKTTKPGADITVKDLHARCAELIAEGNGDLTLSMCLGKNEHDEITLQGVRKVEYADCKTIYLQF